MRPRDTAESAEVYECYACGARATAPDARVCEECGSHLRNIGRARDL